jgi:hypothetical protein
MAGFEPRQKLVTNPVPFVVQGRIALVFTEDNLATARERGEFSPSEIQQRAHQRDPRIHRQGRLPFHPGQSLASRSAQQPEHEQFDLIIGMMSQRNVPALQLPRRPRQERMAKITRRHFHRLARPPGTHLDTTPSGDEEQPKLSRRLAYKSFVRVAAAAPKLMVEMGHDQPPTILRGECTQQVQQNHRIQPTRNRDHDGLTARQ